MSNNLNTSLETLRNLKKRYDWSKTQINQLPQKDKYIFYFNFTNDEEFTKRLNKLVKLKPQESNFKFGEYLGQNKEQSSAFYYFSGIAKNNKIEEINYYELTNFKLFFCELVKLKKQFEMKIILHYCDGDSQINDLKVTIQNHIFILLDGLFEEQKSVLLLFSDSKLQKCKCYQTSIQNLQQNIINVEYKNEELLQQIDFSINYFTYTYNEYCSIGYLCYKYLNLQMNVISNQLVNQLKIIQNNIYSLLELPIDSKNEQQADNYVKSFSKYVYTFIIRFNQIIQKEQIQLASIIEEMDQAINYWEDRIMQQLEQLIKQNPQINILSSKNPKIFNFNFQQILLENQELFNFFSAYQNTDLLQQEFKIISKQNWNWIKYFDMHLPYSLKFLSQIPNLLNKQEKIGELMVCLLGLTKVGKSTLLNILSNLQNMDIVKNSNDKDAFIVRSQAAADIQISDRCLSETQLTFDIKIDDIIFTDTPGFQDTDSKKRLFHQLRIFNDLERSSQIVFLMLIDGEKLCENKNDLFQTLEYINTFLGNRLGLNQLKSFILPVFNKLRADTMTKIIEKWDNEIMKNCEDYNLRILLNVIKTQIDLNRYIEIKKAKFYKNTQQSSYLMLKKEKKEISNQIIRLANDQKFQEISELKQKLDSINSKLDQVENSNQQINFDELSEIKTKVFALSNQLRQEQITEQSKFIFTCNLTPEMKDHYEKVIQNSHLVCDHLTVLITDAIINDLLFDQPKKIQDILHSVQIIKTLIILFYTQNDKFQIFDSLIKQFGQVFNKQKLITDLRDKLKNVNHLSSYILDNKLNIKIDYLELQIKNLETVLINNDIENTQIQYTRKFSFLQLMISFRKFLFKPQTNYQQQQIEEANDRFKLEIIKQEYLILKRTIQNFNIQ